jgi:hypothetical protein
MARIITKELVEKIADKLKATKIKSRNKVHDEYAVEHEGRIIAIISIRRGSAKDQGHDHIPRDLQIRPSQARFLAQCSWSREDYLESLRERGLLGEEEETEEQETEEQGEEGQ